MELILDKFTKLKRLYFKEVEIKATIFNGTIDKNMDCLYFIKYMSHCFVVIFLKDKQYGIIADGTKQYLIDNDTRIGIRTILKIRLSHREYNQQLKIEHCGSSAVLIGIKFIRAYKLGIHGNDILPPKSWINCINKQFHKFKSPSATKTKPHKHMKRELYKCNHCSKHFKKRRGLNLHMNNLKINQK